MSKLSIQIVSDLHTEFSKIAGTFLKPLVKPLAKYLFIAGDIGNLSTPITSHNIDMFFNHVSKGWEQAFYITGNHEYYHSTKTKSQLDLDYQNLLKKYPNIHFLNTFDQPLHIKLQDQPVKIIGRTLWSQPIDIPFSSISDFNLIHTDTDQPVSPYEFHQWCNDDIDFLTTELTKPKDSYTKTIVMTHFLPLTSMDIPNSKYGNKYDKFQYYFGNNLHDIFYNADIWISGHTHESFDLTKTYNGNTTRWICNPGGYPSENLDTDLDTVFHIELL